MDRKHSLEWKYKIQVINNCSRTLSALFTQTCDIADVTLVPIPPIEDKNKSSLRPQYATNS
ncbi:MAG: hypothetical protein K0S24_1892 [Sphingobacterium sp.]|jgi:hypothetical protein|nr:hypothetical protein [Sphingobacterium sp.]